MRPSPSRIANRHVAAIFQGPPALEVAIRDWMISVYAGHVLENILPRIAQLQDLTRPAKTALAEIEDVERTFEQRIRALDKEQSVRFRLPVVSDSNVSYQFIGVNRGSWTGNSEYQIGVGTRVVSYDRSPWTNIDAVIRSVKTSVDALKVRALRVIRDLQMQKMKRDPRSSPNLDNYYVELNLLRRACLRHTNKPKSYTAKAVRTFPIDLDGWKYVTAASPIIQQINTEITQHNNNLQKAIQQGVVELDRATRAYDKLSQGKSLNLQDRTEIHLNTTWYMYQVEQAVLNKERPSQAFAFASLPDASGKFVTRSLLPVEKIQAAIEPLLKPDDVLKALHRLGWTTVKAVLDFKGHSDRGGLWSLSSRELQVDATHLYATSVGDFDEGVAQIARVVRHEVQHVGQDLLREIRGLHEEGGLPSRKLRDESFMPSGVPKNTPSTTRVDHALRDVEFYTDLADAIDFFMSYITLVPINGRPNALRTYVGLRNTQKWGLVLPVSKHFTVWKARAPDKWKKAVAEFVKAVAERGVRIGRP